jgi:putative aldouronate transport system permease protein
METKKADRAFDILVFTIILIMIVLCILPFLHVAAISFSSNSAIIKGKVWLWPVEWDLQTYKDIFRDRYMVGSLFFTVQLTFIYTAISMLMTTIAAYPLTQKRLRGRRIFLLLIIFTMFFNGGIIPDYILMKNLNLINTMWALILPQIISAFNLIILKTFFSSIPESLVESARLDGCSDLGVLFKIILPLSTPVLATLSLFYAVTKWNSFQDALFYITEPRLFPIQLKLYQIVKNNLAVDMTVQEGVGTTTNLLPESLKSACVMFATIPIVLVYPWLQKYFIKGVMIGAIKG